MSDNRHRVLVAGAAAAAGAAAVAATAVFLPTATAEPTRPPDPAASYRTDEYGYSGSGARCDYDQMLVELGRTARALVAICVDSDGQLEYRGVRLSDKAALTTPAGRSPEGTIIATNDGVTYTVTPQSILVSEGDTVLYRDAWTEFREPRFPAGPPTSSSTSTPASTTPASTTPPSATPPSASTAPTVSTTTVTLTPTTSSAR